MLIEIDRWLDDWWIERQERLVTRKWSTETRETRSCRWFRVSPVLVRSVELYGSLAKVSLYGRAEPSTLRSRARGVVSECIELLMTYEAASVLKIISFLRSKRSFYHTGAFLEKIFSLGNNFLADVNNI